MYKRKKFTALLLSAMLTVTPLHPVYAETTDDTLNETVYSITETEPSDSSSQSDASSDSDTSSDSKDTLSSEDMDKNMDPAADATGSISNTDSPDLYTQTESSESVSEEATEETTPEEEALHIEILDPDQTESKLTIRLHGYTKAEGEKISAAVWSFENGQDDLRWYTLNPSVSDRGFNLYHADVKISDHKSTGSYAVHVYSTLSGKMTCIGKEEFTITKPECGTIQVGDLDQKTGSFPVIIKDIVCPSGVQKLQIPIWCAPNQSDLYWYTALPQSDGTYKTEVKLANHRYATGTYQIHSYITAENGIFTFAGKTTALIDPKASIHIACDGSNYNIDAENIFRSDLTSVEYAIWSEENGQDDLKWLKGSYSQTTGISHLSYKASTFSSFGLYHVHMYGTDQTGKKIFLGKAEYEVAKPTPPEITVSTDPEKGSFTITLSNIEHPDSIQKIQIPTWSKKDQSDLVWYDAKKHDDGTFTVSSNISKHNFNIGTYISHVYITPANGSRYFAGQTTVDFSAKQGSISLGESSDDRFYPVSIADFILPGGVSEVRYAVWSDKNGQDDLKWYTAKNTSDSFTANIDLANHKTTGLYHIHAYGLNRKGNLVLLGVSTDLNVEADSSADISIENMDSQNGSFYIRLQVQSASAIQKVQIPVWSASNQSDLHWYTAEKQDDGSYLADFNIYNHHYNLGIYNIHVYCTLANGIMVFSGKTTQEITLNDHITVQGTSINSRKNAVLQNPSQAFSKVQYAVWSKNGGQDDLVWYTASKSGSSWTATVDYSRHKHAGLYYLHVYADGKFLTNTSFYFNSIDVKNTWSDTYIAHALGGIDQRNYTNSLEAFELAYANGMRSLEVDFIYTSDGELVCNHDWTSHHTSSYPSGYVPTAEEFLSDRIQGRYTPLSFLDVCGLMQKYPDVWLITDSKYADYPTIKKEFEQMVSQAFAAGYGSVLNRFVIQIYNEEMYSIVNSIYPFKNYIFTMYQIWNGTQKQLDEFCNWSMNNHVNSITMPYYQANPTIVSITDKYGLNLYVHTVNDASAADRYLKQGVAGIYSDFLH